MIYVKKNLPTLIVSGSALTTGQKGKQNSESNSGNSNNRRDIKVYKDVGRKYVDNRCDDNLDEDLVGDQRLHVIRPPTR